MNLYIYKFIDISNLFIFLIVLKPIHQILNNDLEKIRCLLILMTLWIISFFTFFIQQTITMESVTIGFFFLFDFILFFDLFSIPQIILLH